MEKQIVRPLSRDTRREKMEMKKNSLISHQTRTVAARGTSEGPSGRTGWPEQPFRGHAP